MSRKIVVVGAVALGPKVACRVKRTEPDAEVILIDREKFISYGGCGIPYYVSGDVSDSSDLMKTSFHMVRDEYFFTNCKDVKVMTGTEVVDIDRKNKKVKIVADGSREDWLSYDKLVLGTGCRVRNIGISGLDLKNVYGVGKLQDAIDIKAVITAGEVSKAVVVGAGFIGLEMAEALADMWGIETSVIEIADQVMPGFVGKEMARLAMKEMEDNDVSFYLGERVISLEGDGSVKKVVTDKRELEADLVIMAPGVVPNSELAKKAGLAIGPFDAILVNDRLETSDPDIYSGGDCVAIKNLVSGQWGYFPLGSMANRQGRVIGSNITGSNKQFKGAVGSFVVKIFDGCLCGAGLNLDNALKAGFDAVSVQMCQLDRAHFYPDKDLMYLELVVERGSRKVLGIQGYGANGDATVARINAVAAILDKGATVDDISNLEIAYSPPFASAMDVINALGNVADNLLNEQFRPIGSKEFEEYWEKIKKGEAALIDCRAERDARPYVEKYPDFWKSIPQDELRRRINEVPKNKKVVLVCNTGVRSYEAQLNLNELGYEQNVSVQGGVAFLKKYGVDL
ncbi:MAG: FAD-dependent oxidoreductase [Desulfobacteraceae bacterium]|nr:FAD-dependent oxidoreductase [Desulfobacteraceae bacterium]MCB9494486.1 FAD-dependent oxidoreductase [Desulfobacteraceae bacterium]